ncbi:TetR/AcrR family transcriptional regulator [Planomonospora parontospora]|uniref:TetR/AcrR family transcriptional regulator n=1 Tax=Planomonospora parontospora TaxID=58119 RepID=UPI001670B244|nr:TetR family transcriptional regulator [Planomonospora parontospora]GGL58921.1 TetR family transcriptional regulator [Planomonospora parontospora subsp. antibiotica]GII20244.1 TetR family transcriptional regulator [Planomonospora parontospora subsp. antibiotica]
MRSVDDDLNARARIRNAALELFGAEGVNRVSLRAVASRAGVSHALVLHHFATKEGLRKACDDHVISLVRGGPEADLGDTAGLAAMLEAGAAVRRYLGRAFLDGTPQAAALFDEIVEATGRWLDQGVGEGWVQPSEDPRARAALYVTWLLAPLAFGEHLSRALGVSDVHDMETMLRFSRAGIEIFTRGVFADERVLTAWDAVKKERGAR